MKKILLTLLGLLPLLGFGQDCPQPTNLIFTNITATSATLSWNGAPGVTSWNIEVVPAGTVFTGNGVAVTSSPYVISQLVAGQSYAVCVRSVCGPGVYSPCTTAYLTLPFCSPAEMCNYNFNLTSAGGNGWNGNTMSVLQNGTPVATLSMASGSSQNITVPLCDGVPFELYWNSGGQNPQNVGIQVTSPFLQALYTKLPGTGSPNSQLYQGMAFCAADGCPVPYMVTATTAGTSATVSWIGLPSGQWQYYIAEAGASAPNANTAPTGTAALNPFTVQGLEPDTDYEVYVRAVCADFGGSFNTAWSDPGYFSIGSGNFLTGTVALDADGDGQCSAGSGIPGIEVIATVGTEATISVYTNAQGNYSIDDIEEGTDVPVTIQVVVPDGFVLEEEVSLELDFPLTAPQQANFCLPMPEGVSSDIAVILTPVNNAQAGFAASYAVIVLNNSPLPATGVTVTLTYPPNVTFVSANSDYTSPGTGAIVLEMSNISAFGTTVANVVFNVMAPPVNTGGEILTYTATADMAAADANEDDNINVLTQTVVNALDPNDITVHEGEWVHIDQAGEYLHYTIRFQNTGTAPAVNIRIENELDTNLDWDTFDPISASHDYTATRRNGKDLEFMFENIFLPDSTANEPESHGFVTYRIKPKAGIVANDEVHSTAAIYFDFNEPVITNTAITTFGILGLHDTDAEYVTLYPNPVKDELHINVVQSALQNVQVYDLNGRLCLATQSHALNTQGLTPGLYIVKVETDRGISSFKLIKQ